MKTTIGIIGTGRFAMVLSRLLSRNIDWQVRHSSRSKPIDGTQIISLEDLAGCDMIFPAVPISALPKTLANLSKCISPKSRPVVVSVASVMVQPERWMLEMLPNRVDIVVTHPVFGPQSTQNGTMFEGLPLVWQPIRVRNKERLNSVTAFMRQQGIHLFDITSADHDRIMSRTQLVSFVIGQIGLALGWQSTPLDTMGFRHLLVNQKLVAGDSTQLFQDICEFNPFAEAEMVKIATKLNSIQKALQHAAVHSNLMTVREMVQKLQ